MTPTLAEALAALSKADFITMIDWSVVNKELDMSQNPNDPNKNPQPNVPPKPRPPGM